MKKKVKTVLAACIYLVVAFALVVVGGKLFIVVTWTITEKSTGFEKGYFNQVKDDYEDVVKYLITSVVAEYPDEEYICLGFEGTNVNDIELYIITDALENNIFLKFDDEIAQSLANINDSFIKMGYSIDAIRIKNGVISFTTIDGVYSLTYTLDEDSDYAKIQSKQSYGETEELQGKWRHEK